MHIGTLIRDKRLSLGLTLEQVAQGTGVVKATVLRWENGLTKNIGPHKIAKLSEVLDIQPELLHRLNESEARKSQPVPAFDDDIHELNSTEISDDSMAPVLLPGDIVWFAPLTEAVGQGDLVAVRLGADILVRYAYPQEEGYLLTAANPQSHPIQLVQGSGKALIVGIAVQAKFEIVGKIIYYQRRIG